VSTFYLLPSRAELGGRFAAYLNEQFPGLEWPASSWAGLAETLAAVAAERPEVYAVFRDDLPDGEDLARALADGFGAGRGDVVIDAGRVERGQAA
jgi:hypothetical protein